MQALLVSQNVEETAFLNLVLQQAGFVIRSSKELERGIDIWVEKPADVVVIAIDHADLTFVKKIELLRSLTAVPIILVCESMPENLQVGFYESGVDLVMIRPFSYRLLLAQIRSIMRRTAGLPFFSLPVLTQLGVKLDPSSRTVQVEELKPSRLTQLEFRLLYTLMTNIGQIIPTDNIVEFVWGYSGEGNRELVRGLVKRLRSKVEPDPHNPKYIKTEPGIGYYFNRFENE